MCLAPRCMGLTDNSDCVMLDSGSMSQKVTGVIPNDSGDPQKKL